MVSASCNITNRYNVTRWRFRAAQKGGARTAGCRKEGRGGVTMSAPKMETLYSPGTRAFSGALSVPAFYAPRRLRFRGRLVPGLHADQVAVVVNIPHGNWMRRGVDVGPAVVSERLGHLVDVPLTVVLIVADHLPAVQHAGPDFAVRIGLRFVEVRVRARGDRRKVLLDQARL